MKILIVIPVYNEELILERNILKLFSFCHARFSDSPEMFRISKQTGAKALPAGQKNIPAEWQIVIADNNSSDKTAEIAKTLAANFPPINYLFVTQRGKGIAIKTAWQKNLADIYCFMDADLATDLSAVPELIFRIEQGYDVVVGSRFHPKSKVRRSLLRKLTSQGYRLILKFFLGLKINDAPCGFKAINNKIKENILPQVKNKEWFFDSELVILAEKQGYKIKEVPVIWQDLREDQDKSKVKILSLGINYFKEVLKLRKRIS